MNTIEPIKSGKVREIYDAGDNLIIAATDRISAFDCILPTPIPDKGRILNTLSVFWFARTGHIIDNHLLLHRAHDFPAPFNTIPELQGRSMLVRRAEVLPIECVVRGYLTGSGWTEYQRSQSICGVQLPAGLRECERLSQPIFTPTTKADAGHDEPIDFETAVSVVGREQAERVRDASLQLYEFAAGYAAKRGVLIADTKFEFGIADGDLILVDEALTPDSSRFWDAETYAVGRAQDSFDKQFVRDYLNGLTWGKTPPAPELPAPIVQGTRAKYEAAYSRLTGLTWPDADVRPLRRTP